MRKLAGKVLSEILNYERACKLFKYIAHTSNLIGYHNFDIFDKIPDKPYIIAFNHAFKAFGKSADHYIIGAASPRKIRFITYEKLYENDFYKPLLEKWETISTSKIKTGIKTIKESEMVGIAPEGLEHQPNKRGYLGTVWIAKTLNKEILPVKIENRKNYTTINVKNNFPIPQTKDRKTLRSLTERLMDELTY